DDWTDATLNYPLTTGDHLFVSPGGRAEMQIDGNAVRLDSNTNFGFLNLDDNTVQISLTEGSVDVRLRNLIVGEVFEIDTPNGAVTLERAGDYRIDTDPNRNITLVTVRDGQAEMYQQGNSSLITAHQTARFTESGHQVNPEYAADDFDRFVASRNGAEDSANRAGDYVPDDMTGADDLYTYGRWDNDPLYGAVWVPPVDPGWQPYTTGRWVFVEPWGWTWVDDAPWGFAPFHYGRWVMARGVWVWIPGERRYRPVYAPALVGFIGGSGFGVSIGWFPLGPREPWIPSWHASRRYIERVNVRYVTNVNVINVTAIHYVNRQNVTFISQADFAAARPVRGAIVRFPPAQVRGAPVISSPRVVPLRQSVAAGSPRSAPFVRTRPVVARTPPPPAPVSFESRQQMLMRNSGEPLRSAQIAQIRSQQPAAVINRQEVRAIGNPDTGGDGPAVQSQRPGRGLNRAPASGPGVQPNPNRVPDRMNTRPAGPQQPQENRPAPVYRQRPGQQPQSAPQTPSAPAGRETPQQMRSTGQREAPRAERPQQRSQAPERREAPPRRSESDDKK
ncbi:MAG TPA: DUF6600 domain-containing protein, partial [Bryobacteraceae bacterium]|nr:DUF6600 domain-containing protein [Bryobacteraceae bacterium]